MESKTLFPSRRTLRTRWLAWSACFLCFCLHGASTDAAEIVRAEIVDGALAVDLDLTDASGELEVQLLGADGTLVDSAWVEAEPGADRATVWLDPRVDGLAERGRQHQLRLVGDGGAILIDIIDYRLGIVCDSDGSDCGLVARGGMRIEKAVRWSDGLGAALGAALDAGSVDLVELAVSQPELLAPILDASIDLAADLGIETGWEGGSSECRCFYSVEDSGRGGGAQATAVSIASGGGQFTYVVVDQGSWDGSRISAWHDTVRAQRLNFHCLRIEGMTRVALQLGDGWLSVDVPAVERCPVECSSPVRWSLHDLAWETDLESIAGGVARSAYDLDWSLDGGSLFSRSDSWILQSPLAATMSTSGSIQAPVAAVVRPTPTTCEVAAHAEVEVSLAYDARTPSAHVRATSTVRAEGLATCAPPAVLVAETVIGPWRPSKVTVIIDPVDP